MKILQIIPQLTSGGAERFVVDLSNELSLRHNVTMLVSFPLEGNLSFYLPEVSSRVKVYSLSKKLGLDLFYIFRLFKAIREESPDIVHTHISAFAHFAILKWLFPKVKFVHTVHSDAKFESGGNIQTFLKRLFFKKRWCTAVTISKISDLSFGQFYGSEIRRTLIYNGRPLSIEWSYENIIPHIEGNYNLVSIGHISKVKNHILLCTAVAELSKKGKPIDLYMFGRFADEDIVNKIKSLNCSRIHLLGEISNPRQYLRNADAFCMSSLIEGMPISLIEGLSCGLIPICTAVGGIVDIVEDGVNGFLSQDMTVESYISAIERFLSLSSEEIETMKHNCIEKSKMYSIEECSRQYEILFNR